MRQAGAFKPHKIVSSRERVTRKNECLNMLWKPRLAYYSFVGGRFSFCPLSVFQSIRLLFIWLGFGFIFGFSQFVKNDS